MPGDGFEPGFHIKGRGGVLLQGWNVVTELKHWVGTPGTLLSNGKRGLRISVGSHDPDPYLFEHHDPDIPLTLEMTIKPRQNEDAVTKVVNARIHSTGPFVIDAWEDETPQE